MIDLSRHPIDWFIHFGLCFLAVWLGWAIWFVVAFVAVMIEYEQKFSYWNYTLSWRKYIFNIALGDLIADALGIGFGILLKGVI